MQRVDTDHARLFAVVTLLQRAADRAEADQSLWAPCYPRTPQVLPQLQQQQLCLYDPAVAAAGLAALGPVAYLLPCDHIAPGLSCSVHLLPANYPRRRAKVLIDRHGQRLLPNPPLPVGRLDLDDPLDHARYLRLLDSYEHPCEAIVLAIMTCGCGPGGCVCIIPEPKPSRAAAAKHTTTIRKQVQQQAEQLPLLTGDGGAAEPAAVDEKLARGRRMDRQLFQNVGALVFDTCCCCYRGVQQHVDKLGNKQTAASRIKGKIMSDQASVQRLHKLLPDVMFDLLRKFNKQHGTVHSSMPAALRQTLWMCDPCHSHIKKSRWKSFPPMSMQNDLLLPDVPAALADLTQYERHLVARVRTFHQLVYLPYGQTAARGLCISYPSETNELVDSLPSTLADSDFVIIRQAQDNSSDTKPLSAAEHASMTADEQAAAADAVADAAAGTRVLAHKTSRRKTPVQFQVRPNHVKRALEWLKYDNELYRSIRIESHLDEHEIDPKTQAIRDDPEATESDVDAEPDRMLIDHVAVTDPAPMNETRPMQSRLLQQVGQTRNEARIPIMQIQRASGKPILINYQRACEAMAYPGIFPSGQNHFGTFRALRLTPKQYFRSRFLAYRERCLKDPTYLFFVTNALDWYELEQQVGVRFRMWQKSGYSGRSGMARVSLLPDDLHSRDGAVPLTRADLEEHAKASVKPGEENFVDQTCFTFMQSMRGTLAYWNKCKRDLFSMLAMLGPPTWFVTFSADEFGWLECLMSAGGLTREQAQQLTQKQKEDLIANNPDLVSKYFDHRWASFFRLILKSKHAPVGVIKDHFWRVEFQRRGSPHVHMLLWVEGAPIVHDNMTDVEKDEVAAWVSRYICTQVPKQEGDLRDLVLRLQQHAHTPTCTRTKKGTVKHCRFHFPRPQCDRTRMVTPQDKGLPKRTIYVTKRDVEDVHTNAYNPELLSAWRGNMDLQFIGSTHGVVAYVCAYMTKDEPEGFRASMQAALASLPPTANRRQQMMRMGSTILSKRELPAQEACYKLFGLKLRDASRTFVRVDARPPALRTRILKSHWQQESEDSTDLFHANIIERYKMRPVTQSAVASNESGPASGESPPDWDRMTLTHFASNYVVLSSKKAPQDTDAVDDDDAAAAGTGESYLLQNGRTWIRRTRKQLCLQTSGLSAEKDGQAYYYSVLMLHLPFRSEADLLVCEGVECSPMQAFISRSSEFVFGEQSVHNHREFAAEIERTVVQLQVLQQTGELNVNTGIQLASDIAARPSISRTKHEREQLYDEPEDSAWLGPTRDDFLDPSQADELQRLAASQLAADGIDDMRESREDRTTVSTHAPVTLEQHNKNVSTLNPQQRAVYDMVAKHTAQVCTDALTDSAAAAPDPLRLFVSGGGGTGKSYVLSAIRDHIMLASRNRGCMVCAPTGVAAFHVQGRTLHGALSIMVDQKERANRVLPPLEGEKEKDMLTLWEHVHYLIIDEISMVSASMLAKVSCRLNQLMLRLGRPVRPHSTFGTISVIVIGDLYQLAPVMDKYVFSTPEPWAEFRLCELMANERQTNDPSWCSLLNRIRVGDHSSAVMDFRMLKERLTVAGSAFNVVKNPVDDTQEPWDSALRIFCTNDRCKAFNDRRTNELSKTTTVYALNAQHAMMQGQRTGALGLNIHTVPASWLPSSDDDCGGLTHSLRLGVGSRVMLRRNIATQDGLVNGAAGVVVSMHWPGGAAQPECEGQLPVMVMVLFDNKRVGRLQNNQLPLDATHLPVRIEPKTSMFDGVGGSGKRTIQRKQMPLMLCWAATVHKVQGLTMDRAVIDLGAVFSAGQAYVALSRVKSLAGVALCSLPRSYDKVAWCEKQVVFALARLRLTMHILPALIVTADPEIKVVPRKNKSCNWSVQAVVGKRFEADGQTKYRIRWTGYGAADDTWEPIGHLASCTALVQAFESKLASAGLMIGEEPIVVVKVRKARRTI